MTRLNIPLFVALAASLLSAIDARDQLPHQRMIRKRGPAHLDHVEARAPAFVVPRWPGLVDRQAANPSDTASASVSATRSASSASASASASSVSASSSSVVATSSAVTTSSASASLDTASASSTSRSGLLDSLTAVLGGTQSSTSSLASSTSITSSSSSSTISPSSAAPASTSTVAQPTTQAAATTPQPTLNIATPSPSQTTNPNQSVAVVYSTASVAPEAAQSQAAAKAKTAKITRNTIISLVVVASCIGGAIAIWTVIRKWKLSPSERFDDRMQPIDWAPTGGAAGARDGVNTEKTHHRAGSNGSHGSFTSGGVGQSELGHTGAKSVYSDATGHGNGNAQYGAQAQDFPPPHDFTAGAYGQYQGQQYAGAGYADLRRGPSVTESNYSHGTYSRGPAYEAQPGAAGVPPLPNPYGGYEHEEHGYQPQGQAQGQGQYRGY